MNKKIWDMYLSPFGLQEKERLSYYTQKEEIGYDLLGANEVHCGLVLSPSWVK